MGRGLLEQRTLLRAILGGWVLSWTLACGGGPLWEGDWTGICSVEGTTYAFDLVGMEHKSQAVVTGTGDFEAYLGDAITVTESRDLSGAAEIIACVDEEGCVRVDGEEDVEMPSGTFLIAVGLEGQNYPFNPYYGGAEKLVLLGQGPLKRRKLKEATGKCWWSHGGSVRVGSFTLERN